MDNENEVLFQIAQLAQQLDGKGLVKAWDILKARSAAITQKSAAEFYPGQKVWFNDTRRGRLVRLDGTVVKVNAKSVQVLAENARWNIGPSLLNIAN